MIIEPSEVIVGSLLTPTQNLKVRELIAWPLDAYPHRPAHIDAGTLHQARTRIAIDGRYAPSSALIPTEAADHSPALLTRADLLEEMHGLDWSIGRVDLTRLIAFQRRLNFHPTHIIDPDPFAHPKPLLYTVNQAMSQIETEDPNLHFRVTNNERTLHAGSPFFEAATYRNRWFLRDGYHRAYTLLRAGITQSSAIIVHARMLTELGAAQPWFFPEDVLFSARPPLVTDFLDDRLNIEYTRPQPIHTLHVNMEAGEIS